KAPFSYPNSSLSSSVPGMAGQFTFTNGPVFHGDSPWTMRAMMSLPVPLSPWIRTGTLAAATLFIRDRSATMASDFPNTMESGGISPMACTSELTEFVVIRDVSAEPVVRSDWEGAPQAPNGNYLWLSNSGILNLYFYEVLTRD